MDRPLHILIVDDDPDDIDFLREVFRVHYPDTRFTVYGNGQEALNYLLAVREGSCPDITFLDLHLPGKNGYDVLREIRASDSICNSFVTMILSTSLQQEEADRCREAGCDGFYSKPTSLRGYDMIVEQTVAYLRSRNR